MYIQQKKYGIVFEEKANREKNIKMKLKKLYEYEKTGLTPEQIIQMDKLYEDKCRELANKKAAVSADAKRTITQLEDLHAHCMIMAGKKEEGEVWEADCKALETAIEAIKQQDNSTQDSKRGMRIYLSGPITGTEDYMERFARAEEILKQQGYHVINPAKLAYITPDFTHEEYMKICFALLDACDGIHMLEGWCNSIGANQEYGYAIARSMKFKIL